MGKNNLVSRLKENLGITRNQAELAVDEVFDAIREGLIEDGEFKYRGLGAFSVKLWKARSARNPQTGEPLVIPARNHVSFKPSADLERELNP